MLSMNSRMDDLEPCLFVRSVPTDLQPDIVEGIFSRFGNVKDVRIKPQPPSSKYTYAFVYYHSVEEAKYAFSKASCQDILGMRVEMGKNPKKNPNKNNSNGPSEYISKPSSYQKQPLLAIPVEGNGPRKFNAASKDPKQLQVMCSPESKEIVEVSDSVVDGFLENDYIVIEPSCARSKIVPDRYPENYRERHDIYQHQKRIPSKYSNLSNDSTSFRNVFSRLQNPMIYEGSSSVAYSEEYEVDDFEPQFPSRVNVQVMPCQPRKEPVIPLCVHYANADNCCSHTHNHCSGVGVGVHSHMQNYGTCHHHSSCNQNFSCPSIPNRCCTADTYDDPNVPRLKPNYEMCSNCKHEGKFLCANCDAPYCSRACQEKDWPQHKVICLARKNTKSEFVVNNVYDNSKILMDHNFEPEHENRVPTQSLQSEIRENCSSTNDISSGYQSHEESKKVVEGKNYLAKKCFNESLKSPVVDENTHPTSHNESKKSPKVSRSFHDKSRNLHNEPNNSASHEKPLAFSPRKKTESFNFRSPQKGVGKNNSFNSGRNNSKNIDGEEHARPFTGKNTNAQRPSMRKKIDLEDKPKTTQTPTVKEACKGTLNDSLETNGITGKLEDPVTPVQNSSNILVPLKIKASSIKRIDLAEIEMVSLCFIKSPSEFWVQRIEDTDMLKQITSEMLKLSESKTVFHSPAVGDICAALYIDNNYYRAQITKVSAANSEVYFLDYGNAGNIKSSDLCYLTANLGNYPALAIPCKLADVKPKGGREGWTKEAVEFFAHLVGNKVLKAHVLKTTNTVFYVDLIGDDGVSISAILKSQDYADPVHVDKKPIKSSGNSVNKPTTSFVQAAAVENELESMVPTVFDMLKLDTTISAIQVYQQDGVVWGHAVIENITQEFTRLTKELQMASSKNIAEIVEEGDLAAACSPTDGLWYRSIVLKRNKSSFYVRYVDFGNEEEVTNVRELSSEHINICSPLLGFKVANLAELDKFQECTNKEFFKVTVKSQNKNFCKAQAVHSGKNLDVMIFTLKSSEKVFSAICQSLDNPNALSEPANKPVIPAPKPKQLDVSSPQSKQLDVPTPQSKQLDVPTPQSKQLDVPASTQLTKVPDILLEPAKQQDISVNLAHSKEQIPPTPQALRSSEKPALAKMVLAERALDKTSNNKVTVVWVKSAQQIYVQRVCDAQQLADLTLDINMFCSNGERQPYTPIEGELVCARFLADGNWYRSLILKALPNNRFNVLFIDFGNEDEVSINDIEELDKQFFKPVFSICVSLFEPPKSVTESELAEKLLNKVFDLHVVNSKVSPKQVVLYENGQRMFGNQNGPIQLTPESQQFAKSAKQLPVGSFPTKKKNVLEVRLIDFDGNNIRIEHIDSSKNFYVRLVSQEENLFGMQRELSEYCRKNSPTTYDPEIDDVVCVYWENTWVRGYVTEVKAGYCSIKLIDHEPIIEVEKPNIRPLSPKFFYPIFLISVYLEAVPEALLTKAVCDHMKTQIYKLKLMGKCPQPIKCQFYSSGICINENLVEKEKNSAKPAKPLFDSLMKQTLPLNETLEVIFWFGKDDLYYLQKKSDLQAVESMTQSLITHCGKSSPMDDMPVVGEVVCAKCSDGSWYRACIEEVNSIKNQYKVLFIDYGNSEYVSKNELRNINQELLSYPIFCICVKVTNADLIKTEEFIVVKVSEVEQSSVTILTAGGAVQENQPSIVTEENVTGMNGVKCESQVPGLIEEAGVASSTKPKFTIVDTKYNDLPLGKVPIVIIHALSTEQMFFALYDEASMLENAKLLQVMSEYCNKEKKPPYRPVQDELVLAQYKADDMWYRACVLNVEGDKYDVFYLDYGNIEATTADRIREMTEEFLKLPIQATLCSLGGFDFGKVDKAKLDAEVQQKLPILTKLDAVVSKLSDGSYEVDIPSFAAHLR